MILGSAFVCKPAARALHMLQWNCEGLDSVFLHSQPSGFLDSGHHMDQADAALAASDDQQSWCQPGLVTQARRPFSRCTYVRLDMLGEPLPDSQAVVSGWQLPICMASGLLVPCRSLLTGTFSLASFCQSSMYGQVNIVNESTSTYAYML